MYNNFYDSAYYGTESINEAATFGTAMLGMFAGIWIFSMILSLIYIISYWKIFKKANKPGWASIVPVYNMIVMIEIAKLPMWYIALFFVPFANIYAIFKINIEIAKKFGKEAGFGIGMTLLAIIFIPLLAFSDNKYEDNNMETSTNNTFDATNVINNNVQANDVNLNNQAKTIEPSIPENINVETEVNPLPTAPIAEPTIENNLNTPIEPTIDVEPVVEGIQENVEPLNNIPQYEPTINNVVEEPKEEVIPTIDNVNINEPVENIEVNVELVIPTAPVVEESIPNAFNSTPIMETVNEPIQTETLETINPTVPEIENVVEPVIEPVINEPITNVLNNNTLTDNKFCKNCGNELPNIVSICPNCGTDNE